MNKVIILIIFTITLSFAQGIGRFEDSQENHFQSTYKAQNYLSLNIIFNDGGFGLGTIYRKELNKEFSFYTELFMSESKDNEIEIYNPWTGQYEAINKKNRILITPLNFGIQYRLFSDLMTETFRPYIGASIGPTFVMVTPYSKEFFSAFGSGTYYTAASGSICFGSYIGKIDNSLFGLEASYYFIKMLNKNGVEGLFTKYRKELGGFYINIIIGTTI